MAGGIGGHSGDDINKERANALKQLLRFLYTELQYDYQLISIEGGNKPNAICREAEALIAVPSDEVNEMVEDAKAGRIDAIITKSVQRFGRNTEETLSTMRELLAAGVIIYFSIEGYASDSPDAELSGFRHAEDA